MIMEFMAVEEMYFVASRRKMRSNSFCSDFVSGATCQTGQHENDTHAANKNVSQSKQNLFIQKYCASILASQTIFAIKIRTSLIMCNLLPIMDHASAALRAAAD